MKFFFLLILFSSSFLFASTYYIDNNSGNDLNNGRTPSSAWKTLTKVNAFSFTPGDSILFIRDGIWRGQLLPASGNASADITYAAYGTGAKPQLLGSVNVSKTSDWVNLGGNIWQSVQVSNTDIGNLIFNKGASCGTKKWTSAALVSQGDFWWDKTGTKNVELYSVSNPGTFYSDIEAAIGNFIVYMVADSFVHIEDLAIKYGAADGIEVRNTHHVSIKYCELSFIGGTELTTYVRYGGGIQFWAKSHDNTVERCKIWEIYDDGVTNQGNASAGGTVQQYNLSYINNVIWNCSESSFCFFIQPAVVSGSYMKNIHFENNTCVNAGGGWAASQRPDAKGFQIYCSMNTATTDSIFIRNNIFYKSRSVLFIDNTSVHTWPLVMSDYNCWFTPNTNDTIAAFWTSTSLSVYNKSQFSSYQSAYSKDAHSLMADPLFADTASNNYYLSNSSPCINSGTNTDILFDIDLTPRPQGPNDDIGAYEFVNVTGIPELKKEELQLTIYPNAASGMVMIDTHKPYVLSLQLFDMNGVLVLERPISDKTGLDTSDLETGIYMLVVKDKDNYINKKLVVVH